jgi:hypothetical protein
MKEMENGRDGRAISILNPKFEPFLTENLRDHLCSLSLLRAFRFHRRGAEIAEKSS